MSNCVGELAAPAAASAAVVAAAPSRREHRVGDIPAVSRGRHRRHRRAPPYLSWPTLADPPIRASASECGPRPRARPAPWSARPRSARAFPARRSPRSATGPVHARPDAHARFEGVAVDDSQTSAGRQLRTCHGIATSRLRCRLRCGSVRSAASRPCQSGMHNGRRASTLLVQPQAQDSATAMSIVSALSSSARFRPAQSCEFSRFCAGFATADTIRGNDRVHGASAHLSAAGSPRPCRPPDRRRHSRRRAAPQLAARRATLRQSRASRPAALPDRDRALMRRLVGDRAAPARHAAASARRLSRQGLSRRRAARRNHPADRRRADPLARRARPCRGRSFGAAGAGRPARARAMPGWSTPCCAASRRTATHALADRATRDTPDWLLARWTQAPTATRPRAPSRTPTATSRRSTSPSRQMPSHGPSGARPRAADRHACARWRRARSRCCPAFTEGAWWVQDAAASLPARLLGDVRGLAVADLCAAPGGKTAQLALAGARGHRGRPLAGAARAAARQSRAARRSAPRPSPPTRSSGKAGRSTPCCSMRPAPRPAPSAAIPTCPGSRAKPTSPCSTALQQRLLDRAVELLKPGGTLVYCVCSLEPEEGEQQIAALLARDPRVARASRSRPAEVCGHAEFITADGDLRTLPLHLPDPDPRWGGLDGFYAARLMPRFDADNRGACTAYWPTRRPFAIVLATRAESGRAQGTSAFMMRVSVAERARLSVLIGRRAFRSLRRRASTRIRCCAGASARPRPTGWSSRRRTCAPPTPPAPAKSTPAASPSPARW